MNLYFIIHIVYSHRLNILLHTSDLDGITCSRFKFTVCTCTLHETIRVCVHEAEGVLCYANVNHYTAAQDCCFCCVACQP